MLSCPSRDGAGDVGEPGAEVQHPHVGGRICAEQLAEALEQELLRTQFLVGRFKSLQFGAEQSGVHTGTVHEFRVVRIKMAGRDAQTHGRKSNGAAPEKATAALAP